MHETQDKVYSDLHYGVKLSYNLILVLRWAPQRHKTLLQRRVLEVAKFMPLYKKNNSISRAHKEPLKTCFKLLFQLKGYWVNRFQKAHSQRAEGVNLSWRFFFMHVVVSRWYGVTSLTLWQIRFRHFWAIVQNRCFSVCLISKKLWNCMSWFVRLYLTEKGKK